MAWSSNVATGASVPSAALAFVDSIAIFVLISLEHSRSIRPSSLLTLYLLLSLAFDAVQVRTLYLRQETSVILGLSTAVLGSKLCLLLLEVPNKRSYLQLPYKGYSPEATSSVVNRGLFWWLNPLIKNGFNKILTLDDLYATDPELLSERLQRRIEAVWDICMPFSNRLSNVCTD